MKRAKFLKSLLAFFMAVVFIFSFNLTAQAYPFGPSLSRTDYAAGGGPATVAIGDFNADSKLDMAASDYDNNTVSVFLGNGDGTFSTSVQYGVGTNPASAFTADFNGDSRLDLAVANASDDNILILIGNGDGTFTSGSTFAVSSTPNIAIIDDFNGDNKKDVVTSNYNSNNITILLGDGAGSFSSGSSFTVGTNPYGITSNDFNGDNKKDLAVANENSMNASILLGNGDGTFTAAANVPSGTGPYGIYSSDFNGDSKIDLAVANYGGDDMYVVLGNGDGTFGTATVYSSLSDPSWVHGADLNKDGKQDLIVSNSASGDICVYFGNGNGTFGSPSRYLAGSTTWWVASADFNADTNLDLTTANYGSNSVSVFINNGSGGFGSEASFVTRSGPVTVRSEDFDNDGKKDLAVGASLGGFSILLNNGDSTFGTNTDYSVSYNPGRIAAADLNNDNYADVIVPSWRIQFVIGPPFSIRYYGYYTVYLNNGDGTLGLGALNSLGSRATAVHTIDLDKDGDLDIAVNDERNDSITTCLNRGNGTFSSCLSYLVGDQPIEFYSADFDSDGNQDLATVNTGDGTISILQGNGTGGFTGAATAYVVGTTPMNMTGGDFDGDGDVDLVVVNNGSKNISVLTGNNDCTFNAAVNTSIGSGPYDISSDDYNNDGKIDLAVADQSLSRVTFLLGNGNATFTAGNAYSVGGGPKSIVSDDFNGNGRKDIAAANEGSNNVSLLYDLAAPTISGASPSQASAGDAARTVNLSGTGFAYNSVVKFGTSNKSTTYVSPTQLQFSLSKGDQATEGNFSIQVSSAITGTSGVQSNSINFPIQGGVARPPESYLAPSASSLGVVINDGAVSTDSRYVTLNLSAGSDVSKMAVSNQADLADAGQEVYSSTKQWDLCSSSGGFLSDAVCQSGLHTVYVKFFTQWGQPSSVYSDSINLMTSQGQSQATPTAGSSAGQAGVLADGTVVKESGSPAVYLIEDGKKRPFPSARIFAAWGYTWDDVQVVMSLADYPLGDAMTYPDDYEFIDGMLVKASDAKVYAISHDKLRWIASEDVFHGLYYRWEMVNNISNAKLAEYEMGEDITTAVKHPDGALIKYQVSPKVYVVNQAEKRWIFSEQDFNSHGFCWDLILDIPTSFVYADGAPVGTIDANLSPGSQGDEVTLAQTLLKALGYFPSDTSATGYYGSITQAAVTDFQEAKGLAQNGDINTETRNVMNAQMVY